MPYSCCVVGCNSKGSMEDRKFYRFPMLDKRSDNHLAKSQARQHAWLNALKKPNFFASNYSSAKVCDLHFISGKSAKLNDIYSPDWVPSLKMGHAEVLLNPATEANEEMLVEWLDEEEADLSVDFNGAIGGSKTKDCGTQTDFTYAGISSTEMPCRSKNASTQTENRKSKSMATQTSQSVATIGIQTECEYTGLSADVILTLEEKIKCLEELLSRHLVTIEYFDGDDTKTCFVTGITKFETMKELFTRIEEFLPQSTKLTRFQIFFIFLARLRLNLTFKYFSYQFGVSLPTISKHFYKCLHVMYSKLRTLVFWPEREAIKKTMPLCFQIQFGNSIVVIVDCFEIFMEKPSVLKAAAQCFSTYKHAYTVKYLIGINPQGSIQFISSGYGGRASDKEITCTCGLFEKLKLGDVVMADRGFFNSRRTKSDLMCERKTVK